MGTNPKSENAIAFQIKMDFLTISAVIGLGNVTQSLIDRET